jgi:glycerophosphoryl diester phosphodiesterase
VNCIAHRGFAATNAENTLSAVRSAVERGVDGVEVDVRRCGSGELVVVHDPTVDRVTGATGAVADYSSGTLSALSVLGGDGIPSLDAVCAAVPPSVTLHLELKETDIATDAVDVARRHDCSVVVSSLDSAVLGEIPRAGGDPVVDTAVAFSEEPQRALETAREFDCTAVHPHWHLCTESFVGTAHEEGFGVNAWTVDSPELAATLADAGVDGVVVDAPEHCPAG